MAAAEPDLQPVKRSNSLELIPPSMSELRVVLLGGNWSQRSSVGNFILGQDGFTRSSNTFKKISAELEEKQISVINSPDVWFSTAEKLTEFIRKCAEVSDPGPHAFLLVLQPESFTEYEKDKIYRILQAFSDRSFDQSLVLILKPRQEGSMNGSPLKDLIRKCRYRYLKMEETEREQLLIRFGQIVKENDKNHVRYKEFVEAAATLPSDHQTQERPASRPAAVKPKSRGQQTLPPLNLVLFGPSEPLKTAAAKVILGHKDLPSECVRKQGEVFGRGVSLVQLPALDGKAQQEVMEESFRCVSLCDPEGVHAFILVLPVGPLTDEDKGELHTIQDTFSSRVNDFTIILFTTETDAADKDVCDFIKENRDIQDLLQICGGRYFVLDIRDRQQIKDLMETVETICGEKSSVFSADLFTKVLIERILKVEAELQDVKQKSEDEQQSTKQLRKETEEVKKREEELKKKHREETKTLQSQLEQQRKEQIQMLKEKDEIMENEREKRKKEREEEEKKWRKQEELQRKEWKQKLEASENRVKDEREQREAAEKRLQQSRRERTRERDAWDKEKVGILERMHQDLKQNLQETKQNLEEERARHRKLQEVFYQKRRKWTYLAFALLLSVSLVLLYVYQSH